MDIDISKLAHREHEVLVGPVHFADWQRCYCGKQIVHLTAYWSDDAPFTVTTGQVNHTQRFPVTRHLDGTFGTRTDGEIISSCYNKVDKCPKCGALDTLKVTQLAYGDQTECTVDGCNYSDYYSIGD